MRNLALAILAGAMVSMAGPAAAQNYAPGYPVCLLRVRTRPTITNAAIRRWLSATCQRPDARRSA
jgi:hypothetical protein